MAMSFGEAKDKVSFWVDDLNKGYFTTPQLNRFVNDAQFEAQKLLLQAGQNWYVVRSVTTLIQYQADYILPSDFLHEHRLEMITNGFGTNQEQTLPISQLTLNQQDIYPFSNGTPQGYYLKKERITLVPPPDTNYTLRLYYSYRVAQLVNDNDTVDVPEQFSEMVPLLAAIDCFIKDGRDASLLIGKKAYYENLLKQEAQDRAQDRPRMVVCTGDYGGGVLF